MVTRRNLVLGGGAVALVGGASILAASGPDYKAALKSRRKAPDARSPIDPAYLAFHAALAANSHNTQPWRFEFTGSRAVILPDLARATRVVDPDNHHLYASLGCAAENLMLAAAAVGSASAMTFLLQPGGIEIDLVASQPAASPLFRAIAARQSTRVNFDGRPVSAADLAQLEQAATVEGCRVIVVPDRRAIENMLGLMVAANDLQVSNAAFVEELRHWMRFNAASAIGHGDGLYSACSGNPTLPDWLGDIMFKRVFTAKAENAKCVQQVRSASGLAIFVSDRNDPMHWAQAGRSAQRFALQATALGLKVAFLNQVVEDAEYRSKLATLLGIGDHRPDLVMRFGYGPELPQSMRRPLTDVIATTAT